MKGYKGKTLYKTQDGTKLKVSREFSQRLMETKKVLSLSSPKCKLISDGFKSLIIKGKLMKELTNTALYIVDKDLSYGIIKIHQPYKINLKDFNELYDKHQITNVEREQWWKGKEILYAYPFDLLESFKEPRGVKLKDSYFGFEEIKEFVEKKQEVLNEDWKEMWGSLSLLNNFKDKTLIQDCISIVGTYAEQKEIPDNMNILIRMKEPSKFLKKVIESRLTKELNFAEKLNFIWGDSEKPYDSHC